MLAAAPDSEKLSASTEEFFANLVANDSGGSAASSVISAGSDELTEGFFGGKDSAEFEGLANMSASWTVATLSDSWPISREEPAPAVASPPVRSGRRRRLTAAARLVVAAVAVALAVRLAPAVAKARSDVLVASEFDQMSSSRNASLVVCEGSRPIRASPRRVASGPPSSAAPCRRSPDAADPRADSADRADEADAASLHNEAGAALAVIARHEDQAGFALPPELDLGRLIASAVLGVSAFLVGVPYIPGLVDNALFGVLATMLPLVFHDNHDSADHRADDSNQHHPHQLQHRQENRLVLAGREHFDWFRNFGD